MLLNALLVLVRTEFHYVLRVRVTSWDGKEEEKIRQQQNAEPEKKIAHVVECIVGFGQNRMSSCIVH